MTPLELKEARRTLGMTQRELAEALELDGPFAKDSVRRWENGKRAISGPVRVAVRYMLAHHKLATRAQNPAARARAVQA